MYNKSKEVSPDETVKRVQSILEKVGIENKYEYINSSVGTESVSLKSYLKGNLFISTNGKGIDKKLALASAYGEYMERFQNMFFINKNNKSLSNYLTYSELHEVFYYKTIDELLNQNVKFNILQQYKKDLSPNQFKAFIQVISYHDKDSDGKIPCVKARDIIYNEEQYIPYRVAIWDTNGMSAGNTDYEALVQGMSELLERKCQDKIIINRINPPVIPEEYYEKFNVYKAIKSINSSERYKIIVKDCSLNSWYPVVGVLFIDKERKYYKASFGSYPIFEIALERTITELFQNVSIDKAAMVELYPYINVVNNNKIQDNIFNMYLYGTAIIPEEFYRETDFSYEFKPFEEFDENVSNAELYNYLVDKFKEEDYSVCVVNNTRLGFPAFKIITSDSLVMTTFSNYWEETYNSISVAESIKDDVNNFERIDNQKALRFIQIIEPIFSSGSYLTFKYIVNKEIITNEGKMGSEYYYSLFLALAYLKIGNKIKALNYIKNIEKNIKEVYDNKVYEKFRCFTDILMYFSSGTPVGLILDVVSNFYPQDLIKEAFEATFSYEKAIEYFGFFKPEGDLYIYNDEYEEELKRITRTLLLNNQTGGN